MSLDLDTSIGAAKQWLRDRLDQGERCPVCTQMSKIYKRKIHAGMARVLIIMHHRAGTDWTYLPSIPQKSRDATGLAFWELIEEQKAVRDDGGRAGFWRVTTLGEAFLLNRTRVPKYARIYDGRCLGLEGDLVSIKDALGTKFNYDGLMKGNL